MSNRKQIIRNYAAAFATCSVSDVRLVPDEGGEGMSFVSAEAYTFSGDKIAHIQTYQPM